MIISPDNPCPCPLKLISNIQSQGSSGYYDHPVTRMPSGIPLCLHYTDVRGLENLLTGSSTYHLKAGAQLFFLRTRQRYFS